MLTVNKRCYAHSNGNNIWINSRVGKVSNVRLMQFKLLARTSAIHDQEVFLRATILEGNIFLGIANHWLLSKCSLPRRAHYLKIMHKVTSFKFILGKQMQCLTWSSWNPAILSGLKYHYLPKFQKIQKLVGENSIYQKNSYFAYSFLGKLPIYSKFNGKKFL